MDANAKNVRGEALPHAEGEDRPAFPVRAVDPNAPARRVPKRAILVGGLVAAVLAVAVYRIMVAGQEETDDAQVEADVVPVGARVAGQLARVAVVENQAVKRGDLIVQIDAADYEARLAQAEAELATAQAREASAVSQERFARRGPDRGRARSGRARPRAREERPGLGQARAAAALLYECDCVRRRRGVEARRSRRADHPGRPATGRARAISDVPHRELQGDAERQDETRSTR